MNDVVEFQVMSAFVRDVPCRLSGHEYSWVFLFGRHATTGASVCVRIRYFHCLMLELPKRWRPQDVTSFRDHLARLFDLNTATHEVVLHHDLYPFCLDPEASPPQLAVRPYVHLWCCSRRQFYFASNKFVQPKTSEPRTHDRVPKLESFQCPVLESDIPLALRLLVASRCEPMSTLRIPLVALQKPSWPETSCQLEYECVVEPSKLAPCVPCPPSEQMSWRVVSFDIECPTVCSDDVPDSQISFPNAAKDPIVCICCALWNMHDNPTKKIQGTALCTFTDITEETLLQQGDFAFAVRCFASEKEMLDGFRDYLVQVDPDIITGWNVLNFDWPFLFHRARAVGCERFFDMSRVSGFECKLDASSFHSKAQGFLDSSKLVIPGRLSVDMMDHVRRQGFKFRSFKLDAVASEVLGMRKEDLSYGNLGRHARHGTPEQKLKILSYCDTDARLPLLIAIKKQLVEGALALAQASCVFPEDLVNRGQTFKSVSLIFKYAKEAQPYPFALNHTHQVPKEYQGATVFDVKRGLYPLLITVDFNSLYPSIMREHNLCLSSLVPEGTPRHKDVVYFEKQVERTTHTFQQTIPGLLPKILDDLLRRRKAVQASMGSHEKASPLWLVFNHRQIALKLVANSLYGFTGGQENRKYGCAAIAETVTACGRQIITETKEFAEKEYAKDGFTLVAGDTDSLIFYFASLPATFEGMQKGFSLAAELCKKVSHGCINLAVEKGMKPVIVLQKKNNAYISFTPDAKEGSEGKKCSCGGWDVKRQFCLFTQSVYTTAIDCILQFASQPDLQERLLSTIEQMLNALVSDGVPFDSFVLTTKLGKNYKQQKPGALVTLAQQVVANLVEKRKPGSGPKPGDRVQYVVLDRPRADLHQKVDDAAFVKAQMATDPNWKLDKLYYLDTLTAPLTRIFEAAFNSADPVLALLQRYRELTQRLTSRTRSLRDLLKWTELEQKEVPKAVEKKAIPKPAKQQAKLGDMLTWRSRDTKEPTGKVSKDLKPASLKRPAVTQPSFSKKREQKK